MSKILDFFAEKRMIIMVAIGILLFTFSFGTQSVIISYGENNDYALRLEYTLYGTCANARATLKQTEPAIQNEMYIFDSIDESTLKAVKQMELLAEEKQVVKIMAMGFPKNNAKLELSIKSMLEGHGYTVEILTT